MSWIAFAEIAIGGGLLVATGGLVYWTREQVNSKNRELKEAGTPRVRAWLAHNWQRSEPTLDLIIANLGEGAAKNVKWWFEDVDKADWENRVELISWPDCEENASHVGFLRSGEEIRITMAGGRNLYAPTGTNINQQKAHYPVKPFTAALRFEPVTEAGERATDKEPLKTTLAPKLAYPLNTGSGDGLHRIADAIERGPGRGINWFGKHPDTGMPAGAPKKPDWKEQQMTRMAQATGEDNPQSE